MHRICLKCACDNINALNLITRCVLVENNVVEHSTQYLDLYCPFCALEKCIYNSLIKVKDILTVIYVFVYTFSKAPSTLQCICLIRHWKFPGLTYFPGFPGISEIFRDFGNFPGISGGKFRGFFMITGCNRLYTSQKWSIFRGRLPGFSGISGNFRRFSENVGDFPGISGGKFGGFCVFSGCNRL